MRTVLVTGSAGFLGSHLVDAILANSAYEGYEVIGLDDLSTGAHENVPRFDRFRLIRHDVRERLPLLPDVREIYHLACPASPVHYQRDPVKTLETCLWGTRNVLDLAWKLGARVVFSSTSEVYGDPEVHPQVETYWGHANPIGPRSMYDEGKRGAEALCASFARQHGADVRIARIFNTFGPRMAIDDGRVVSNYIVQALRGEPITVYGDGTQTRSLCYVDDTIHGLMRLMAASKLGPDTPINIGNPFEMTMNDLAKHVAWQVGADVPVVYRPLPQDDPRRRRPDITRARLLLNWQPTTPVAEGIARTVNYFRDRLASFQPSHAAPLNIATASAL